jgi:hypothetical protein
MSNFDFSSLNDNQVEALRSQLRDFISGAQDAAACGLVENLAGHASGHHGNAVAGHASGHHGNAVAGHSAAIGHGNAVAGHGNAVA